MKFAIIAGGFAVCLASSAFAVPIVANGDFETNASAWSAYPGYNTTAPNPSSVTDFTNSGNGFGLNGGSACCVGTFDDNGSDGTAVLFIQSGGTSLSQTISGFTFGHTYEVDFDYNARNCCSGTAGINVSVGGYGTGNIVDHPVGGSNAYHAGVFDFLAGASGTETLTIKKYDAVAGDSTALFDNFVIKEIATPEPASLSLLALGGVGLLARRRHA